MLLLMSADWLSYAKEQRHKGRVSPLASDLRHTFGFKVAFAFGFVTILLSQHSSKPDTANLSTPSEQLLEQTRHTATKYQSTYSGKTLLPKVKQIANAVGEASRVPS